jgi:signal transduction histidine kinase/ActR/RegA family two-component response regulator
VANEPRFKAVAQLADSKTMEAQLSELLQELKQVRVMIFTTNRGFLLAGASADPLIGVKEFQSASLMMIEQAASGNAASDTTLVNRKLLTAISVPVIVNDTLEGVLTIGEPIGTAAAQELKSLTRTDIVFVAPNEVVLSTFDTTDTSNELFSIFDRHKSQGGNMEAVSAGGEHFLSLAGSFPASKSNIGYLLLSSYEEALQKKEETQRNLTLISLVGILFSSVLMWVLISKITKPLRKLRDSAEAVGRGDFSRRVEVESNDECGELATSFNRMTENLKSSQAEVQNAMQSLKDTQAQLIQTEKLSAMGKFVAGIAHELNNPLTGVIGFSQMLQESGIDEKQQGFVNRIIGSAERCRRIVQSLLSFSRRHRAERKLVPVNDVVESAVEILNHELTAGNVEVKLNLAPCLPEVSMDPHQMQQVFVNIITNAIQATETLEQRLLCITTILKADHVYIRFQDNGTGIRPEDLPNVFNPFFTTKPVGAGTGLGLSLAYGIVHEHGGMIRAESAPGGGACFTIELPAAAVVQPIRTNSETAQREIAHPIHVQDQKILVIDDEVEILDLIREALVTRGYQVDTVADGESALALADRNYYDLVVCDWKIPGAGGQQIYDHLRNQKKERTPQFLFITGDVLSQNAQQFLQLEAQICLQKPFTVDEFRSTIERVLSQN